jgi:hypothetical protein
MPRAGGPPTSEVVTPAARFHDGYKRGTVASPSSKGWWPAREPLRKQAGPPFSAPLREVTLQEGSGRALLNRAAAKLFCCLADELVDAQT